jgi:hypothetical protein
MSGRGERGSRPPAGRVGGRFAGRNRKLQTNKKQDVKTKKKSLSDYSYYLGSSSQASDYETTTNYIINYIKKTYSDGKDIADALKTLTHPDTNTWKPSLQVSVVTGSQPTDVSQRELENRQYEIEFKQELSQYSSRKRQFEENLVKAYALIWERCTEAMKVKIETRQDFDLKILDDPIELMMAIKQHSMNYQEYRYDMSILTDSFKNLFATKQKEGENLAVYARRFKTATEILESHLGGELILPSIVKQHPDYRDNLSDEDNNKIIGACNQRFLSYLLLEQADQKKYGSLMTVLSTQHSLGNDQYPRNLSQATNVLSNHRHDVGKGKPNNNNNAKRTSDDDEDKNTMPLSFAQIEGRCYCCGSTDHKSPKCPDKKKTPKNEWWINKAQQHLHQHAQSSDKSDKVTTTSSVSDGAKGSDEQSMAPPLPQAWINVHLSQVRHIQLLSEYSKLDMKNWILLDSQSSTTIFCNPTYVSNIRTIAEKEPGLLVHTNGGSFEVRQKADLPDFGTIWFDPNSITNIFSHAEMSDRFHITYDNHDKDHGDVFKVHTPKKTVVFQRLGNNLYVHKPSNTAASEDESDGKLNLVTTVEENVNFYTPRQFERAKRARDLYHAIGTPSVEDFKSIIRMNAIGNNPVTTKDIVMAEKIFGPDVGNLKGKSTRRNPIPVVENHIEIPRDLIRSQQGVHLCIDGMKVNGLVFLTTISRNIYYRTATYMPRQTIDQYKDELKGIIRYYNKAGIRVDYIHADNEFRPLLDPLQDEFQIQFNFANPGDHVPEAERNNRVIKERIRATYHRLPFTHLPKQMVIALVQESAKKPNFFPARHGVSQFYSPRMILHQQNLNYDRHCRYGLGTYVQANNDPNPTNTNEPRTLDCIYLRYNDNIQGGHDLLHLPTNRIIMRSRVTSIPITPAVINQVHTMARQQAQPEGLKISNRYNVILYDAAWIAGVDFEEEDDEDDDDSDYESDEEPSDDDDDDDDHYDPVDADYEELDQDNEDEIEEEEIQEDEDRDFVDQEWPQWAEEEQPNPGIVEEDDDEQQQQEPPVAAAAPPEQVQPTETAPITRSGRVSRPPNWHTEYQSHIQTQAHPVSRTLEYSIEDARVIAMLFQYMEDKACDIDNEKANQFIQTYSLKAGLKKFKERGKEAAMKEMNQLDERVVYTPIDIEKMTFTEKKRAMESLIFLVEKRDLTVKARMCANGSTQREYMERDDASSPTVMCESILITAGIEAKQRRDVMTCDIPNAFVQTDIPTEKLEKGKRIIMKIRGALVDILVEMNPEKYTKFVTCENGKRVIYVMMLKALYGMLESSLLYYKKFKNDIETIGFEVNPYDPCVANRIVQGTQQTICWHVDDLKSSHKKSIVNDEFLDWLTKMYGNVAPVKATRGKRHDYLGIFLEYKDTGEVVVDMAYYVKKMLEDFPEKLKNGTLCPWTERLFKVDDKSKTLSDDKVKTFYTFVMKGMFVCKRARPDIQPVIAFLSTRVRAPTDQDWNKLMKLMAFLKATQEDVLTLELGDKQRIEWFVDAAFAVHPDFKGHTGAMSTLGRGAFSALSTKQKANARSSTEAELIGIDDVISKILWSKRFIEAQGFVLENNVIYRDNTSSMKLEQNGRASASNRGNGWRCTKPLTGALFKKFRDKIMNFQP